MAAVVGIAHSGRYFRSIGGNITTRRPSNAAGVAWSAAHRPQVVAQLALGARRLAGRQLDHLGDSRHLADVAVAVFVGDPPGVRAVREQERLDLDRVDPQQQVGIARRVGLAGHRVDAVDVLVHLAHVRGRRARPPRCRRRWWRARTASCARGDPTGPRGTRCAGRPRPWRAVRAPARAARASRR